MSVCVVIRNEQEALQLKELGLRIAGGWDEPLELWIAESEEGDSTWAEALEGVGIATIKVLSGVDRRRQVFDAIKEESPRLLVVGKTAGAKGGDTNRIFSATLFDEVTCQVMAVRLSDELPAGDSRIIVPCAGGRNSRRALKVAHALSSNGAVAFQLRADTGELAAETGERHLEKIIKKAGLDPDDILAKVALGDDFTEALTEEVRHESYGILIVGASDSGTLRRKLFGTLPDKLINEGEKMTVAVIRAERSTRHRFRENIGRLIHLNIPQLNRNERLALFEEVESKSRWNFDFAALMSLATLIAGMGLLINSGAVVIGAMLVAPLMMPLIGSGLALVQGNWPLCRRALGAVFRGLCFAFVFGVLMGLLARLLQMGVTDQLRMRGEPNMLDLGVALVSGIAASYCVARPKLSGALAGVAIAAALVPPIATVGICLALGEAKIAMGAGLLFGTNIVAIVLGAGMNFALAGIHGKQKSGEWGRRGLIMLILICVGLAIPLTRVLLPESSGLESRIKPVLPEGVNFVSVNKVKGGGYEVVVESAEPVEKNLLPRLKEVIGSDFRVRLRTHLVSEK